MHSVLIVGGGARSHALGVALRASPTVSRVVFTPGTSGLERLGFETAPVASQDFPGLVELAMMEEFDLTVVGPNTPVVGGLVDRFEAEDLPIFGPSKAAAKLEGSKAFARHMMNQLRIRTPKYAVCDTDDRALHLARTQRWARVFKVDGLAYTRGVRLIDRVEEAQEALDAVLVDNVYGQISGRIVVEERLEGQEVTVFALTDGEQIEVLGYVRNHPRLHDGERGLPTRSMGQVTPAPEITDAMKQAIRVQILEPTVTAMRNRGTPLRGALFIDMMLVDGAVPVVIDYNVRFGDPATQTLLSAYQGDFFAVLQACRGEGDLREAVANLVHDPRPRVSLVVVSEGYPERYVRGDTIVLDEELFEEPDVWLYEDGVRWFQARGDVPERLETTGGRTYTIVAAADTQHEAREKVYRVVKGIAFRGMHYRTDIGL